MIENNFTKSSKSIFIVSLLVLTLTTGGLLLPYIIAEHGGDGIIKPVGVGANVVEFRDITNVLPSGSTITTDFSSIESDSSFTITVEEEDANLDSSAVDVTQNATAYSDPVTKVNATTIMTETGPDTGIFTGTINVSDEGPTAGDVLEIDSGDEITAGYIPEPIGAGRLSAQLNMLTAGNVKLNDTSISIINSIENLGIIPVTLPINIEFLDGASVDPANPPVITISYANADLDGNDPALLSMYYNPGPFDEFTALDPILLLFCPSVNFPDCVVIGGLPFTVITHNGGWEQIRDPQTSSAASHDPVGKTITSEVANTDFGVNGNSIFGPVGESTETPTDAQFMLGIDLGGLGGGGGGGLVRPGLVVNVLAGAGSISSFFGGGSSGGVPGGGGGGPSVPVIYSSSLFLAGNPSFTQLGEGGDSGSGILEKNLDESTEPISIKTNESVTFSFTIYENQGKNNLERATMYFFIGDDAALQKYGNDVSKSDTYILFDTTQSTHVVDPHGYFANADFELVEIDAWNMELKYDITFAKPMETTSLLIRSWDHDRNSSDKIFLNALNVVEPSFLSTPNEISTQPISQSDPADIPIWVKNNALWWQQKQIDDSDFVSGIEYLINENIILIPETQITNGATSDEIPSWISEVAGFWAHDAISNAEFVQAMQWLISSGIMVVA